MISAIKQRAATLSGTPDEELRASSLALRFQILAGRPIKRAIIDGFPLVIESIRRTLALQPHDVQILGGIEMVHGRIAEMKTGEGKTLTATLPTFLFALAKQGVHIATVNDYLAKRDATTMRPVFERLGMTVGCIQTSDPPEKRIEEYQKDIVYSTAKEFGFDFLRDRLKRLPAQEMTYGGQRPNHFEPNRFCLLVDEADSIMIDEARTPLIIGAVDQGEEEKLQACYEWAAEHARSFEEHSDFKYDHKRKTVKLLSSGMRKLRQLPRTTATDNTSLRRLNRHLENAIRVNRDFARDKSYAVIDDEIVIIDEFTGRPAEGRKWQQGIHQAVEAREKVPISPETKQSASITVQTLVRLYQHVCGMTGTAWTSRKEFRKVNKRSVVRIPTNKPVDRQELPVLIFINQQFKFESVVDETAEMIASGRAVLIGTRSVDNSEILSDLLREAGIEHQVLNANFIEQESEIIAQAGQVGRVTVATNMAGRGTDIKLDDSVRDAGGLHVILTEIHEAARVDWQLIGRSSRQGDPGSYRIFVSLDDEMLKFGLSPKQAQKLQLQHKNRLKLDHRLFGLFLKAQAKLERRFLTDRMILLRQDKERRERLIDIGKDPFVASAE